MHYYYYYIVPSLLIILTLFSTTTLGEYHPCSDKFHQLIQAKNLSNCHKLPTLGAELGWSMEQSRDKSREVVRFMFGAVMEEEKGWLAWGVNPKPKPEMVGTRAAIGIRDPSNGSLYCKTYNVSYETRMGCELRARALEEIQCLGFEYDKMTQYHVFWGRLNLSRADYNVSKLNIVWQIGLDVHGDVPQRHVATLKNVDSVETLDLVTGKSSEMAHIKIYLRQVHGILNIIGWGTMLPIGVTIARYFRKFPFDCEDWWFYIHVGCQSVGFIIGLVGWAIGMWLGRISPRYRFLSHHVFAIFIFVSATLQTLALMFRPSPEDASRKVWNIYHHFLGYALIALIYINIFEGIRILKPNNKEAWRFAVVGILIALGIIILILEAYTWKKFLSERNKKKKLSALSDSSSKPEEKDEGGNQPSLPRQNSFTSPTLEQY